MNNRRTIITIGMFDGIHYGHRYLLNQLDSLGRELNMKTAVISFDRHPLTFINPKKAPKLLMDANTKYTHIHTIDRDVYILNATPELFELKARDFILGLKKYVNVKAILMGYNNGFGSDLIKTPEELSKVLEGTGIQVYHAEKYGEMEISSSAIRTAMEEGDMNKVRKMLGKPIYIEGKVVEGMHLGTQLGFPTANLVINEEMITPGPGVYAALCEGYAAMLNIGKAPTIRKDGKTTIEVHIIAEHNINSEKVEVTNLYGKKILFIPIMKMRDELKFDNIEDLKKQLAEDRKRAIEICDTFCNNRIGEFE